MTAQSINGQRRPTWPQGNSNDGASVKFSYTESGIVDTTPAKLFRTGRSTYGPQWTVSPVGGAPPSTGYAPGGGGPFSGV